MPARLGVNPLKAWRWVGCFGPELTVCAAAIRVGPARRRFFAVWDRGRGALIEGDGARTQVGMGVGHLSAVDRRCQLELTFTEEAGVETVSPFGNGYAWTRKQAGLPGHGRVMVDGRPREFSGAVIIDDSSGYLPRHTHWRWCAGVGTATDGRALAWNLVEGIHDAPTDSERTLWVDGVPRELPPTPISAELTRAGELEMTIETVGDRAENRLIVASHYRRAFGSFHGSIADLPLSAGYGVMEDHRARW